ncbi:hypothetical protein VPNG_10101 [Cytospora leucostoma]|uniref:Uncharacterized protein n=1 Tax=Cytospora leucostoma TaxID=1230097 RepID=A0A423VI49_9PEZI|nr:hypothetical protein VPNG_10101 [Cytospora leucostoma]
MPQRQMQNKPTAPKDFPLSATDLSSSTSLTVSDVAFDPTYIHSLQPQPPNTGRMIGDHFQQNLPTRAPSPTNHSAAVQKKLMGHIRQRMEERIPEHGFRYKPYIFSENDFIMKMKAYLALNDQEEPVGSFDDFPADPETQRRLAQEIVEAMLNREKHSLMDPEARIPLARINKLSPFEIDLMAWNVLFETRDVHRGKISLPSWGKDWPREEFSSFSERFEAVKKTLYHCKAMVSSLFDEIFAKRLPLNPTAEFSRKNSNKRLNGKRKRDLEIAKGAKQDGFVPSYLRKTPTPESAKSTSCCSVGRPPPSARKTSMGIPDLKRRRADPKGIEAGHNLFDITQNSTYFADIFEQPQSGQILLTDSVKDCTGQNEVPNEIAHCKTEQSSIQQAQSSMVSISGSPCGFQAQHGELEHLGDRNAAQQRLSANSPQTWFNETITIGSGLNPGNETSDTTHFNLFDNQRWTGGVYLPNETSVDNMEPFQGGQAIYKGFGEEKGPFDPISNEELEELEDLLNMPGVFNTEI